MATEPPGRGIRALPARKDPHAQFWQFSLALYARPGVAAALIGLQDRLGLDVNVMLCGIWCAASGRRLTAADVAAMSRASSSWQRKVVRPLRAVRRHLKVAPPAGTADARRLRAAVQRLEIESERLEQVLLAEIVPEAGRRPSSRLAARRARAALKHYLATGAGPPQPADRAAIGHVLAAAFPK